MSLVRSTLKDWLDILILRNKVKSWNQGLISQLKAFIYQRQIRDQQASDIGTKRTGEPSIFKKFRNIFKEFF